MHCGVYDRRRSHGYQYTEIYAQWGESKSGLDWARSDRVAPSANFHLFAGVSRLKLVTNGQDEDDVFGRKPSIRVVEN
jgi:hypothetical protein